MLRLQTTVRTLALAGVATAALIAPHAASARPAADVQNQVVLHESGLDLRAPDAVTPVTIQPVKTDLRSPDAALPVHTTTPTVSQPQTVGTHSGSSDFDLGDAAVGAGIALLVACVCAGAMYAVRRRSTVSLGS